MLNLSAIILTVFNLRISHTVFFNHLLFQITLAFSPRLDSLRLIHGAYLILVNIVTLPPLSSGRSLINKRRLLNITLLIMFSSICNFCLRLQSLRHWRDGQRTDLQPELGWRFALTQNASTHDPWFLAVVGIPAAQSTAF